MLTTSEHTGHITNFQYWADQKTLLSSGNDGLIIAWGSGGNCADKIRVRKSAELLVSSKNKSLNLLLLIFMLNTINILLLDKYINKYCSVMFL